MSDVVAPIEKTERTVSVQGIATHLFEAGPPVAPPLLYLHGPNLGNLWSITILPLPRNFTVLPPEIPAFGLPDRPAGTPAWGATTPYSAAFLTDFGLIKSSLAGHSLGD